MADAVSARHLEGVDLVGLAIGGLALMMGLVIAPRFSRLTADLGGKIPTVTRLVLTPWCSPVLGCVPPTIVADGIAPRATATARAARTFAAFVIFFAALTLFPIRASLPLFSMHSAVE